MGQNSCRIEEFVQITRCFRCMGYGHIAAVCDLKDKNIMVCGNCGLNHETKACKTEKSNFRCVNFEKHNKPNNPNKLNASHSVLDAKCEILKRIKNVVRNKSCYE